MMEIKAQELFEYLKKYDCNISMEGNGDYVIKGISSLNNYKKGSLTWIKKGGCVSQISKVNAVILDKDAEIEADIKFYSINPKHVFFMAAELLDGRKKNVGISPTAIVAKTAKLAMDVSVGNYSCIGENVVIGQGTTIGEHVVISDNTVIGSNCIIKSGAIIGERGFGYSKAENKYFAVPHFGRVVIGDDVDIGNNTCIDRGTIDDTVIGNGVKIDNLCHIAHNVIIDENCCIIANSSIAGSVHIGRNSYIALSASILNQKEIGEGALVGMGAVVTKDIPEEMVCAFSPAKVIRKRTSVDKEKY